MILPFKDPGPSFDEPLEMLEACHGRIEAQLATLERLLPHLARHGADAAAQEAARAVLRYFDTAGVLHQQDEDDDLFPLLRELAGSSSRTEIAAVIEELEREHAAMEALWSRLREQLAPVAEGRGTALGGDEVERFAWLHRRHMEREGAAVLPFARQALAPEQRAALGRRMAARRKTVA